MPKPLTVTLDFQVTLDQDDQPDPDSGEWTFTALGLPYDEELKRADWSTGTSRMKFAPGSVELAEETHVYFGHDWTEGGMPIGRITDLEQTDAGPKITGRISATAKGTEVHTLMKDGVLTKVSAGVETTAWHVEDDDDLLVHDKATAFEWSIVPRPAFSSASLTSVNSKDQNMPQPTGTIDVSTLAKADDVQALSDSVTQLERKVETLPATLAAGQPAPAAIPFASYGEWLQAFAAKDENALNFALFIQAATRGDDEAITRLAYDGGTTADLDGWLKDSWIGDTFRVVTASRKLHQFFASSALPATGMNVEFGTLESDTTSIAEQVAEGDVLAYGKIAFGTDTAPVKTYGGWGEMSRQQIERSAMQVVEKFFMALNRRYAQVTEAALNAAVQATPGHVLAGTGTHDLATADGWIDYVVDAALYLDDTYGLAPEGILCGYDVFKSLAKMRDGDNADAPRLLDRTNGTVQLVSLTGQLFNLNVIPINTGATTGFVRLAHSEAIRTLESGNAPFQLTDQDITNLTNAYSIYGYEAIAVEEPGLLVAPDVTV